MDNQLRRDFLKKVQEGDHIRRLKRMDEWVKNLEIIQNLIKQYDTVKGVKTDKEFLIRGAKVDVLEELLGIYEAVSSESENAMEELTSDEED